MSENAQTLYEQAIAYFDKQKWDQSIEAFSRALSSEENDPSPSFKARFYNGRGVAYAQKNNYDQAIKDFNKALEAEALDQAVTCANRGAAHRISEPIDQSLRAMICTNRGATRLEKGKYDDAISDANEALQLNPEQPSRAIAHNVRGIAYTRKGDYDRAIEDFNEALKLEPDQADFHFKLGYAHLLKKEHEKALEYFLQAGRHNPKLIAENTLCYIASKMAAAQSQETFTTK